MIKNLSYLNIILATAYFLGYLQASFSWIILAILLVIVYSVLVLKNLESETPFSRLHVGLAILTLAFAGMLIFYAGHILSTAIANSYFRDSYIYLTLSFSFALSLICHAVLVLRRALR